MIALLDAIHAVDSLWDMMPVFLQIIASLFLFVSGYVYREQGRRMKKEGYDAGIELYWKKVGSQTDYEILVKKINRLGALMEEFKRNKLATSYLVQDEGGEVDDGLEALREQLVLAAVEYIEKTNLSEEEQRSIREDLRLRFEPIRQRMIEKSKPPVYGWPVEEGKRRA